MTSFILIAVTIVSLFDLISSSSSQDASSSLVEQIRSVDERGLTHLPGEGLMGPMGLRRAAPDDQLEVRATNLLRSVIGIVQSYTDDDFEDLLKAIRDKIEKINNPDAKVVELKEIIVGKLKQMEGEVVGGVRGQLAGLLAQLREPRYDDRVVKLDSAAKRAAALQILTALNDLDAYRYKAKRLDISLPEVVRRGLEALAGLLAAHAPSPAPQPLPHLLSHAEFIPKPDDFAESAPKHKQKSQESQLEEVILGHTAPKREPDFESVEPPPPPALRHKLPHKHRSKIEHVTEEATDTESALRSHKREGHKRRPKPKRDESAEAEEAEKPKRVEHRERVGSASAERTATSSRPAAPRAQPGSLLRLPDGRPAPLGELLLLSLLSLPSLSKVHLQLVTEKDDDDLRSRGFA